MLQAVIESQVKQVIPDCRDGGANHTQNASSAHIETERNGSEGNGQQEADHFEGDGLANSIFG